MLKKVLDRPIRIVPKLVNPGIQGVTNRYNVCFCYLKKEGFFTSFYEGPQECKAYLQNGLMWDKDRPKTKRIYIHIYLKPPYDATLAPRDPNSVESVINKAEELLGLKVRTRLYPTKKADNYLASVPAFWGQSTQAISLWSLIIRIASNNYNPTALTPEQFLETFNGDHWYQKYGDNARGIFYHMVESKSFDPLTKHPHGGDIHGAGILSVQKYYVK